MHFRFSLDVKPFSRLDLDRSWPLGRLQITIALSTRNLLSTRPMTRAAIIDRIWQAWVVVFQCFPTFFISEIAAVQLLQAWLALAQWQGQQILVKPWALKKETALLAAFHSRFLRISEIFLRFSQNSLDYITFPQFA